MAQTREQTSSYADDVRQQFNDDWQQATDLYQKGVDGGYSESDADQIYLQPIRDKWKIIQSTPSLMQDKDALDKMHTEYGDALNGFYKNINSKDAYPVEEAFGRFVRPVQSKYASGIRLPKSPRVPATDAGLISRLPKQVINEVEQTQGIPQANIGTAEAPKYHPYSVKVTAQDANDLRNKVLFNIKSGMDSASASRKAIEDVFGTSPSLEPNIVTNAPGTPEIKHKFWFDTPAVPPTLGTNYFKVKSGQLEGDESGDTGVVGEDLANKPVKFQASEAGGSSAKFNNAAEVKAAYRAGQIDKKSAMQILQDQFGMQ